MANQLTLEKMAEAAHSKLECTCDGEEPCSVYDKLIAAIIIQGGE